jgi:uncharacterized protein (TIGR02646 family)
MIQVQRAAEPKYLSDRKVKWLSDLRAAKRSRDNKKFSSIQARYGHEKIRTALNNMFSGRCAYCESEIGTVASPHIEHYRPKHRYLSLTFEWKNLLLSCPICNDKGHKGTKFPNQYQKGPLIDPSIENPANHLEFIYDPTNALATVEAKTNRGETTIDIFGLNKRPDLLKARSNLIRQLLLLKLFDGKNPEITACLAEIRNGESQYLAWVRKYI